MIKTFSARYAEILQEMLAETAGSILIKTDSEGFIEEASRGIEALGLRLSEMLFKPHIADLAAAGHGGAVRGYHENIMRGGAPVERIEFPLATGGAEPVWYGLSLRPAPDDSGRINGALGLLHSVEGRRSLEEELAAAAMTDVTTGLANARAFRAMLAQVLLREDQGVVAVFEIDRLAGFKLRFGHALADEVVWAFGCFLANNLPEDRIVARLDGGRFAVLMPDCEGPQALALAHEVLQTFAGLSGGGEGGPAQLTASAGLASIAGSLDSVMAHAERALVVARAMGGQRAKMRDQPLGDRPRLTGS